MSAEKPSPAMRLLPSLTDVAFLMPLVLLFLRLGGAQGLLGDGDTGWHIRTGDWILQHGAVPSQDIFSYTKAGQPWYAWEWLWDVVFAWLHRQGGMAAVVLASAVVLCLTFALLFRLARRHCPNVLIAFGATLLATAGSTLHWLARPHLFTLLFVVIFCTLLERVREGRTRLLIYLPFLTVLWTNIHGGFFVGILLVGCYAAGELALWLVEPDRERAKAALARSKPYLVTVLACAAATLVNPYFYRLHLYMYRYLANSTMLWQTSEFQATSFQISLAQWYEPMVLLGVVAAAWSIYRRRFAHAFILAGWLHLALFSVRNLPIYLVVAAPLVAGTVHEWLRALMNAPLAAWVGRAAKGIENFAAEFDVLEGRGRAYVASAAGLLVVGALLYAPAPSAKFQAEYDPKRYPAGALDVLRGAEFSRSVFTNDAWGGYLIYRLYPNTKVFVDGRFDLYGDKFTEEWLDLMRVKYGWEETLKKYSVNTVLLPVDTPLVGVLKESPRWRPVYDDGMAIVFRSQTALARAGMPERNQAPAAPGSRNTRDREVTKIDHRDPRITKSNTRSESL